MRELQLDHFARARIWLDELPRGAVYRSDLAKTHSLAGDPAVRPARRSAAVELSRPLGGRFAYGLLGGELTSDASGRFILEMFLANGSTPFAGSLAEVVDDVRVGLPAEYGSGIVSGAERAHARLHSLASGRLSLICAAHGLAGSSVSVFSALTAAVIHLLHFENADPADAELREIVQMYAFP